MVAIRGNTPKRRPKQSMAEELMSLVSEEEYVNMVQRLEEDDYLTNTEIASMRKMLSGKLWIDTRRFSNRQNQCISTGMYELFGQCVSKSAIDVHAELSQYFLEPDRKNIRDILRKSMKNNKLTFSDWITKINDINRPCNEYCLYLLSHCYNRHAVIITANNLWSLFKQGQMSTVDKLKKCDTVLIWLGESKFAEIKSLCTQKTSDTDLEWQLLSDCINHLHDKNSKTKKQRKPRKTVSTNIAPASGSVNQKHASVTPTREQKSDTKRKRTDIDYKQYHTDGTLTARSPSNTRKVPPKASGPSETRMAAQEMIKQGKKLSKQSHAEKQLADQAPVTSKIKKEPIISTRQSRIQHKLVKEEPTIHIVHRKEKTPENVRTIVRHRSGRLCRSSNQGLFNDELPDLPHVLDLHSPPRIPRTNKPTYASSFSVPHTSFEPSAPTRSELEELLGSENNGSHVVQTESTPSTALILSGYLTDARLQHTTLTTQQASKLSERVVVTSELETGENTRQDDTELVLEDVSILESVQDESRAVVTGTETDLNNMPLLDPAQSDTRAVVTDREQNELDTAEALLILQGSDDNSQTLPVDAPKQIDFAKEMADQERDVAGNDNEDENDGDDDGDDATVIYDPTEQDEVSQPHPPTTSKKGTVSFKHYGIRRHSPKTTTVRKHRCYFCDKSVNSKRDLNAHHRAEHSSVTCPTCNKTFPTVDAYQRHRYVHRKPQQFKCAICDKILPFESDLKRHMGSHVDEKKWICSHPNCGKDFKRKADLDLHAVVHSGILHKCTHPGCKYSNLDPRNVSRHQKVHSQVAKVKCPHCDRKFVHYQQMKRHRENCQG